MRKKHPLKQWLSLKVAKSPRGVILIAILLLNVIFICTSAVVISQLAPKNLQADGFWASVFYTITMVLDAGCIQFVVADVGQASVTVIIVCLGIVLFGMITFTGAMIGYVTSYISDFIAQSNSGSRRLWIRDHMVILNWNSRASEIVNEMLYSDETERIVILVQANREQVQKEIEDRLLDTLEKEKQALLKQTVGMNPVRKWLYIRRHALRNRVTFIVREGDTFSTQKLNEIAIKRAKSIIILGRDLQSSTCRYELQETQQQQTRGNSNTVKTLIQVADLAGAMDSKDDQKIVVEVNDNWTLNLVQQIIQHKERKGKCHIIPVPVNLMLGQILSQSAIMPELNAVYGELLSNKGASFFSSPVSHHMTEDSFVLPYLKYHANAIALTTMPTKRGTELYFVAEHQGDIEMTTDHPLEGMEVELNPDYWLEKRNVIILGHNSRSAAIMDCFNAFRNEWNFRHKVHLERYGSQEILNIVVVDDAKHLEQMDYYKAYPYVNRVLEADIYDREKICQAINEFVDANAEDTSILILSDDMVAHQDQDANALTYLIYVQDIISRRKQADPDFDPLRMDVVVEILNPKNSDIVRSYSIDNIVISNRYISKMITQTGEKEAIYDFYYDILTYDASDNAEAGSFESNELYIKSVREFFRCLPPRCSASQLIRGVYNASPENNRNIVLGYVDGKGKITLFCGDQREFFVELQPKDKLIVFSNH